MKLSLFVFLAISLSVLGCSHAPHVHESSSEIGTQPSSIGEWQIISGRLGDSRDG